MRAIFLILFVLSFHVSSAQVKAKAISYALKADLEVMSPAYADQHDGPVPECLFEVDAYFTDAKLKTVVRTVKMPEDFQLTIRKRLYDISSQDEFNIDDPQNLIVHKKNQVVKPKATGKKKMILGYECKEYTFTDHRGIVINSWITDKLQKNICPVGNYSLKGTALEITTSNGLTYVATDFAEGELDQSFFDLPTGYTTEVTDLGAQPTTKK